MARMRRLPPLQLLQDRAGDVGLDAIVIHTAPKIPWWAHLLPRLTWCPRTPTAAQRRARYEMAACLFPLHHDHRKKELRVQLGEQFQRAWKQGQKPQLRVIYEQMPALKTRRHLRAVG